MKAGFLYQLVKLNVSRETKESAEMITLNDFCSACGECMDVSVNFYDSRDESFICNVVLYAANKSYKTLSASYAYGTVKTFYVVAYLVCCEVYV